MANIELLALPSLGESLEVVDGKVEAKITTQVASIEELRKYTGASKYVQVLGYYAGSTVGGGTFVATALNTTPDNGGTVIVAENGVRWFRLSATTVSLYDFGLYPSMTNGTQVIMALETANLGVVVDCLGLEITMGETYPSKNRYTNGKFIIKGKKVDVQYQPIRSGIGRFISGTGAAANLRSGEWTGAGLVVIGEGAMANMQKCVSGIAIGDRAQGLSRISRDNISIGADSLINVQATTEWYDSEHMEGTRNIGIGGNAGRGITTGYSNVAIGRNAGQGLETSVGSVAIGAAAASGYAPIGLSGDIENVWSVKLSHGVAIGTTTLQYYRKDGSIAIGGYAASSMKTTERATVIGYDAARMLDSNLAPNGGDIVWTGTESGTYSQSGTTVTLTFPDIHGATAGHTIGVRLLDGAAKTNGSDVVPVLVHEVSGNTIKVRSPLGYNTSGTAELRFIYSSVSTQKEGTGITAIGYGAMRNAKVANRTVAIGVETLRDGNNVGQTVAIGDAAAQEKTHFATVAIGYYAAPKVQTDGCVFIGETAGYRLQDGSVSTGVIRNSIAIGRGARVGGDNEVQLGTNGQTVYLSSQATVRSDLRDKADVQPLNLGLSFVKKLSPVSGVYDRRDAYVDGLFTDLPEEERTAKLKEWWANPVKDGSKKETKRHFWFGAQDIRDLQGDFGELPMLQHQTENGLDTYSLAYAEFIPVLVKAIQELSEEVESLKAQLRPKHPTGLP